MYKVYEFNLQIPLVRPSCFVIRRKFLLNHVKTGWEALLKVYTEKDIECCRLKRHQKSGCFATSESLIALFHFRDIAIRIFGDEQQEEQ